MKSRDVQNTFVSSALLYIRSGEFCMVVENYYVFLLLLASVHQNLIYSVYALGALKGNNQKITVEVRSLVQKFS